MSFSQFLPGPRRRLLIIEDDKRVAAAIAHGAIKAGYDFEWRPDIGSASDLARDHTIDLIVLDGSLPDGDGVSFLRELRAEDVQTPIVLISTSIRVRDRVRGLDAGADDYIAMPFAPRELLSRCNSVLRRGRALDLASVRLSNIDFRSDTQDIRVDGRPLILVRNLDRLLVALLRNAGRICKREYLQTACESGGIRPSPNALDAKICRLREALLEAGANVEIKTLKGTGYILSTTTRGRRLTNEPTPAMPAIAERGLTRTAPPQQHKVSARSR